ncbi:DUF6504 family protein [Kineosporia sp. NBRC 101731]|uniref:DUF6504 family protein n=1 Tax=Kineosporia sp. NBRC 101731 TaxID=3032199 RepID=UPI0025550A17|nr:DUF6504 family protein [Kineosporia sp. NBRC 101731]
MARRVSELVDVRVVQETGDAPMAFLWRGRLYVVREVLGHWHERRDWWSTAAARALHGEDSHGRRPPVPEEPSFAVWSGQPSGSSGELPGGVPGGIPGRAREDQLEDVVGRSHKHSRHRSRGGAERGAERPGSARRHSGPAGAPAGSAGPAEKPHEFMLDSECEVWRVEASTGRAFGSGVYDLSRTPSAEQSADSWRLLQVAD